MPNQPAPYLYWPTSSPAHFGHCVIGHWSFHHHPISSTTVAVLPWNTTGTINSNLPSLWRTVGLAPAVSWNCSLILPSTRNEPPSCGSILAPVQPRNQRF